MKKVLIAEDEAAIREIIAITLRRSGYDVTETCDGQEALDTYNQNGGDFDVVLLDIKMPNVDGLEVCKRLRSISGTVGIIMLTAKSETFDKILGLELGADDYVSKPFDAKEVIARIKAVLRRSNDNDKQNQVKEVRYDKLRINLTNYELVVNGTAIDTPPKELELIYHLASNPYRVYTRDQLLDEVWGFDYYGDSRTVDVHVKRLREKLENVSEEWSLKTVWGVGYKFEVK